MDRYDPEIIKCIVDHFVEFGWMPSLDQVFNKFRDKEYRPCKKKQAIKKVFKGLENDGIITAPGKYTKRPHLTEKGWVAMENVVQFHRLSSRIIKSLYSIKEKAIKQIREGQSSTSTSPTCTNQPVTSSDNFPS